MRDQEPPADSGRDSGLSGLGFPSLATPGAPPETTSPDLAPVSSTPVSGTVMSGTVSGAPESGTMNVTFTVPNATTGSTVSGEIPVETFGTNSYTSGIGDWSSDVLSILHYSYSLG